MTELLYFRSDDLCANARVIRCTPVESGFAIELDRTLFHPQGGGQQADIGTIDDAIVKHVQMKGGVVQHIVDRPIFLNVVDIQVEFERRRLNSRLHSAGHLIGNAMNVFDLKAVRAHHWPSEAKVWFEVSGESAFKNLTRPTLLNDIQDTINFYLDYNLMRKTEVINNRRTIGFGELESYPCGGTHVFSTGLIGQCQLISVVSDRKKGNYIEYRVE